MKQEHSKEPWIAQEIGEGEGRILKLKGHEIVSWDGDCPAEDCERIVKCVNALAGVENPEKAVRELVLSVRHYIEALFECDNEDEMQAEIDMIQAMKAFQNIK